MPHDVIDLRSDTVTKPTDEMRRVMAAAEVGDDVLGDDPSVIRLQEEVAELFGQQAGCFVPSGTMANLTALRAQTEPGDEIIAAEESHFYQYETGGFAAIAGCSVRFIPSPRGQFNPDQIAAAMRPDAIHFPHSALLVVENTNNRGGGSVWPLEKVRAVTERARELGLRCHMDGARIWNACVAAGVKPRDYAQYFDTVSACFSKGLGAPVGSIVVGSHETIARVRRFRKMFGGTMRQSGVLAAAALYAVRNHFERLAEDHANAKRLAAGLAEIPGISIDPGAVETDILYFDLDPAWGTAAELTAQLKANGVLMLPTGTQRIRAVTNLMVDGADIDRAIELIGQTLEASTV